uniref:Uncharacterized protein n=1 Tax=Pelusios castaneus TaxID=367368 RepID=A0A8C8SMP4_9SAUR
MCVIFANKTVISLQAIYKDVNSKAYLLRLSSFFNLYLHNCSSNLFLFSIQFSTVVFFLVREFFFFF